MHFSQALLIPSPQSTYTQVILHRFSFYSHWRFLKRYTFICQERAGFGEENPEVNTNFKVTISNGSL